MRSTDGENVERKPLIIPTGRAAVVRGRAAYEAYVLAVGGKDATGFASWDDLGESVRRGWQAAAGAARSAP